MKLIPGTLHVYPLNDYGAVEVGEHRFFQLLPGKPEKLVEVIAVHSRVEAGRRLVEARAGAELRSPLDPLSGLPGFQEQLTVADASAHDAATATWEGLPHELRERAVLDRVTLASSAAKASDLDRGGGCSAALGAQSCSCFERRPASSSCARKTLGCAAAASAAELRYPCAPPFY